MTTTPYPTKGSNMSIVDSNARWEDEDKAMQTYLDAQDDLAAAIYDDPAEIARTNAEVEAEWQAYIKEEQKAAEEQYAQYMEEQVLDSMADYMPEGSEVALRLRDGIMYVTTVHTDAITREHAISQSASWARDLDATSHQSWFELRDGATVWYVQWKLEEEGL